MCDLVDVDDIASVTNSDASSSENCVNIDENISVISSNDSSSENCVNVDNISLNNCENKPINLSFEHNNSIIPVHLDELYAPESNTPCINMAALFNYSDEKDESNFANIYLPEIVISYKNLEKIFFSKCGKSFSPYILNKIWKGIKEEELREIISNLLKEDESLHKWFKRQGPKGKEGGWVDCNAPDGKGGYKSCGRKEGEKRAKYPSCRPTPAKCKTPGKGKKWGKTK